MIKKLEQGYIAIFPIGAGISVKDFKKALKFGDTKCHIQHYLNQLLDPINRISIEELSYAMAVSMANEERERDDVELCVKILNDFLSSLPSERFKRIDSNIKAASEELKSADAYELFVLDFYNLIGFFDNIAFKVVVQ